MQIFQEQKPVQQQRPQMYAAVEILQLDVCQLQSYINKIGRASCRERVSTTV